MEICIQLWKLVIKYKIADIFSAIDKSLEKISKEWPPRSDLVDVMEHVEDEQALSKHSTVDEKLIQRFEAIEQEIKKLDKNRAKDSEKSANLAKIVCDKGLSTETLKEELSTAFPWAVLEENPNNEIPGDVGDGTLSIALSDFGLDNPAVNPRKDKEDLNKELFDKKNIQVEVSDFHGLQDAINGAGDGISYQLKPFAVIIEQDRGECTPANSPYQTLLLLSAVVKEMQQLPNNELNRPILRKWAAISNLADLMGFQVPFFKNLLLKNMHAYLHYSRMNSG